IYTWLKNGKPDVSMCLNASLAGLVGITAGCNNLDAIGSTIVGIVSGILVVVVVEVLDLKFHVDDPVGAVGVHCGNGIWGTIAAGLFATNTSPAGVDGPIYAILHGGDVGAGFKVLGVQVLGIVVIVAWTTVCMLLTFKAIEKLHGLRVSREEEIEGLDITEHGLPTAYAGFAFQPETISEDGVQYITGDVPPAEAVEVKVMAEPAPAPAAAPASGGIKMTKVEIVCKEARLEALKNAMMEIGITGMTVTHVLGCGLQKGKPEYYRGVEVEASLLPKIQVDIVVSKVPVSTVVATAKKVLYTGHIGDGKIFIYNVENVIKVRTGEEGYDALQDVE
ncbi:MAG: ammonium transporter, partial [Eubacteriales bacterium]